MKLHWLILLCMGLGIGVGAVIQGVTDGPGWLGVLYSDHPDGGVRVDTVKKQLLKEALASEVGTDKVRAGDRLSHLVFDRGVADKERVVELTSAAVLTEELRAAGPGPIAHLRLAGTDVHRRVPLELDPNSSRKSALAIFEFIADLFMKLLKMLIVPLVVTSIVTGVAGLGAGGNFGRLGTKTFGYYVTTSFLAAGLGLLLVTAIAPGVGAQLGLSPQADFGQRNEDWWLVIQRMIPENVVGAFGDNGKMLQVIFFSILFGFFITRIGPEPRERVLGFFQGAFEVIMKMAEFVMLLVPYGVFCLMVKTVGGTGFGVFKPLALYMVTVFAALAIHAGFTLPMLLRIVGKVSPWRWFRAMTPALLTAFSTSSSSMTLPVTLETLETEGKVSNKTTSFVAPLGATVNMDGTALYECIGVVFLAQFYGGGQIGLAAMVTVVFGAFFASVGAAGIPSAGLVMMLTILSSLNLPIEGAALLLAVDRPLDMCRTTVNVWSDTCGAAIVASTEGEEITAKLTRSAP
ncbi:MAG: dicarboxylate/amino acid:cation symporter [Planctomycetota bacterium]